MNDEINLTLTARLRHADLLAAARRLGSQKALADAVGVKQQDIGAWIMLGRYPRRHEGDGPRAERFAAMMDRLTSITFKTYDDLWPAKLRREIDRRNGLKEHNWATIETTRPISVAALASLESAGHLALEPPKDWQAIEDLKHAIAERLKHLSHREQEIIKLRYGLDNDGTTYTLDEVSRIFKVSQNRVRQIEQRALRKLQHPEHTKALEPYAFPDDS